MTNLKGKVALVTGGARGIGIVIAHKLASRGAHVVLTSRDGEAAVAAAQTLRGSGDAVGLAVDVGSPASIGAMIEQIDARRRQVDILVNNAGIGGHEPFLEIKLETWENVLRVNLTGAFLVAQAVAQRMVASGHGGTIVNITSISGQRGGVRRGSYAAAKAGLELLTKVMAVELASHRIRVNAVAPGPIAGADGGSGHPEAEQLAYINNLVPMRRYGAAEDVANGVLFLASDESRFITGHVLNVDGGFGSAGLMTRALPSDDSPVS